MDLRVFLKMDGSGFQQGLANANQLTRKWGEDIKKDLRSQIGGAFTIGAIAGLGYKALETAANISKLATMTGLSTDKIQELGFAADQSESNIESIASAYAKLVRAISDARGGGKESTEGLRQLGVSLKEIASITPEAVFERIASSIKNVGDETEYSAAMMKVLGKSAMELKGFFLEYNENKKRFESQWKASPADIQTLKDVGDQMGGWWGNTKAGSVGVGAALRRAQMGIGGLMAFLLDVVSIPFFNIKGEGTMGELWQEAVMNQQSRQVGMTKMKRGPAAYFQIREGDFGPKNVGPHYDIEWKAGNLHADAEKAAEIEKRIQDEIFRGDLEILNVEEKRLVIKGKIAELERKSVEETYQGNYEAGALAKLEAEQWRTRLIGVKDKDLKNAISRTPPSDSLISVGNFLGTNRNAIENLTRETNRLLRDSNTWLEKIYSKSSSTSEDTLGVPD